MHELIAMTSRQMKEYLTGIQAMEKFPDIS